MVRVFEALLLSLVTLALVGCGEPKPLTVNASSPPAGTAATSPTATQPAPSADESYIATGPLVVENQVDVQAQREGIVFQVFGDTGGVVRKGQLLALLDNRQLLAEREAARARMRSSQADEKNWEAESRVAQVDLERAEEMWKSQLITKQDLEHARYKVVAGKYEAEREHESARNVEAMLQSLELEIEKTRIIAPFEGVVGRRYVRAGQKVAVGDRLFWVTATAPLRVKFTLPERFLGRIKKGQELAVSAAIAENQKHMARVIQVSPVVDAASGTIEVLAELIGPAGNWRPGMAANIQIDGGR